MRSLATPCLTALLILVAPLDCLATKQSIFSFRASDGWLVEVIPPDSHSGSSATVNKTPIADVWDPIGSARNQSGRILSLTLESSGIPLVAFDPFARTVEEICEFNRPLMNTNDLTFGPSGELLWAQSGPTGTTLYAIDIQTCEMTEWGSFPVTHLRTIEFHQGAFYCTGAGAELFRVDPSTFEVTVVLPSNYYCGFFGLSSDGSSLFHGWTCGYGANSPTYNFVGVIDPLTGEALWSIPVQNDQFHEGYSLLEVVDQPDRPIPMVNRAGVVLFVVLIGLAGVLVARQR